MLAGYVVGYLSVTTTLVNITANYLLVTVDQFLNSALYEMDNWQAASISY